MNLEAKTHIIRKRLPTKPLSHLSAPCHCLLFWCLSAQDPLVHTGLEGLGTVRSSGVHTGLEGLGAVRSSGVKL